jgi:hypothetical protein
MKIRPDPLPVLNDKRRDFCSRFDGYGDFCSSNFKLYNFLILESNLFQLCEIFSR